MPSITEVSRHVSDEKIDGMVKTPEFQKRITDVGPVLLESGLRRGLSALAIKAEIDGFAKDLARRMIEVG